MNYKYLLGALLSLPLLPFMYLDSIRIRKKVPKLPEAKEPSGLVKKQGDEQLQLLVLGESTVAGVGVTTHQEGFAGTLATALSDKLNKTIKWNVYAKSGYTAKQVKNLLVPKIKESHADLIVIGLGGNDAFTLNTPYTWKKDIKSLITELRKLYPHTPIAFTNMPPIKEFPAFTGLIKTTIGNLVELLGEELQSVTSQMNGVYCNPDVITINGWRKKMALDNNPADFFSDGVHPSKLTYQVWAKDFCNFLLSQLQLA